MGKSRRRKGGGGGGGGGTSGDDWETASASGLSEFSVASYGRGEGNGAGASTTASYDDDPLEAVCEALYEKRASTRETALAGLVRFLQSAYRVDACMAWRDTLADRLLSSMRRGKAKEARLACQAAAALALTVGGADLAWVEASVRDFLPVLEQTMGGRAGGAPAVRAYGVLCYVGSEDHAVLQGCIERLARLACGGAKDGDVRAEAMAMVALLLSISVPVGRAARAVLSQYAHLFAAALDDGDVRVRSAAGDALAILRENFGEIFDEAAADLSDNGEASDAGSEDGEEGEREGKGEGKGEGGVDRNALCDKMSALATASWTDGATGKRMGRRERAAQRAAFRRILSAMGASDPSSWDGPSSPPRNGRDEVRRSNAQQRIGLVHGDCVVLERHGQRVAAAAMKAVFASGFQAHMQHNALMHQVFGYQPRTTKIHLSAVDKRMALSPNSAAKKHMTKQRNKGRRQKSAMNDEFYAQD